MKTEFISYEQALILKELGFDEPCLFHILGGKINFYRSTQDYFPKNDRNGIGCSAILYQQAFRWFREKHNLVFNFINFNIVKPVDYHWSITWNDEAKASSIVKTYEEAELECLNKLIEIVKNK